MAVVPPIRPLSPPAHEELSAELGTWIDDDGKEWQLKVTLDPNTLSGVANQVARSPGGELIYNLGTPRLTFVLQEL